MRKLYTSGLFLCLVLFCNPQAHARVGETYGASTLRYQQAGYIKARTEEFIPSNSLNLPYFSWNPLRDSTGIQFQGREVHVIKLATEITWTKKFDNENPHDVVSIQQVFYGEHEKKLDVSNEERLKHSECVFISYRFRDCQNFTSRYVVSFLNQVDKPRRGGWSPDDTGELIWNKDWWNTKPYSIDKVIESRAFLKQDKNMLLLFDNDSWDKVSKDVLDLLGGPPLDPREKALKDLKESGL